MVSIEMVQVGFCLFTSVAQCEPVHEKTNNLGSDLVQHKPGCTVTEYG